MFNHNYIDTVITQLSAAHTRFTNEALLEEKKQREKIGNESRDYRTIHASRSTLLQSKAKNTTALQKKLYDETLSLQQGYDESTLYTARELLTESIYFWINRKEPTKDLMETLLSDQSFIPFSYNLPEKKKRLLTSEIHILHLTEEMNKEITEYFRKRKGSQKQDVTTTIQDLVSLSKENIHLIFKSNTEYKTNIVIFKLYILGLMEK